jgi:hypothetical protein
LESPSRVQKKAKSTNEHSAVNPSNTAKADKPIDAQQQQIEQATQSYTHSTVKHSVTTQISSLNTSLWI